MESSITPVTNKTYFACIIVTYKSPETPGKNIFPCPSSCKKAKVDFRTSYTYFCCHFEIKKGLSEDYISFIVCYLAKQLAS